MSPLVHPCRTFPIAWAVPTTHPVLRFLPTTRLVLRCRFVFDSNAITPGTRFMTLLAAQLRASLEVAVTVPGAFQGLKVCAPCLTHAFVSFSSQHRRGVCVAS